MIVRTIRVDGYVRLATGTLLLAALAGCGGGKLGSELPKTPDPRALSTTKLSVPADEPFSIVLAPTQESPDLGGTTDADAHASADGDASATAEVSVAGQAIASFQIGHAVKNESDRQVTLTVLVHCKHKTNVSATPPAPVPDAKANLTLYARDDRNSLLRTIELAEDSSEDGDASSNDVTDVTFSIPLGPRRSVSVFLAGNVETNTHDGRRAKGLVKLSELRMEFTTKPAPPVSKTSDEQG